MDGPICSVATSVLVPQLPSAIGRNSLRASRVPLPIFLYEILKIALGWSRRCGLDRYTLCVSVGIIGNSDSDSGPCVFRCLSVYLGGEHWTDTLLFRFNLHPFQILRGLRLIVIGRIPRLFPRRLSSAKRLTSIARNLRLSRSMRAVVAMSVESNRLTYRPDASNHLPFPFRSTLRIS